MKWVFAVLVLTLIFSTGAYAQQTTQSSADFQIGDLCLSSQKDKFTCFSNKLVKCDGVRWTEAGTPLDCNTICQSYGSNCLSNVQPVPSLIQDALTDYTKTIDGKYCAEKDNDAYACAAYQAKANMPCRIYGLTNKAMCGYNNGKFNVLECQQTDNWMIGNRFQGNSFATMADCNVHCKAGYPNCVEVPIALFQCTDYIFGIGSPSWSLRSVHDTLSSCNAVCKNNKCIDASSAIPAPPVSCPAANCKNPEPNSIESNAVFARSDCSSATLCRVPQQGISSRSTCLASARSSGTSIIWCRQDNIQNPDSGYCTSAGSCITGYTTKLLIKSAYVKGVKNGNAINLVFSFYPDATINSVRFYVRDASENKIPFETVGDCTVTVNSAKECTFTKNFGDGGVPTGSLKYGFTYDSQAVA